MSKPKYVFVVCGAMSYKPLLQWQSDFYIKQYADSAWRAYAGNDWQELPFEPLGKMYKCHANCLAQVAKYGGKVVSGWRQLPMPVKNGIPVDMTWHSVWERPDGRLLEITPLPEQFGYNLFSPAKTCFMESPCCWFADDKPDFESHKAEHVWRVPLGTNESVKYLGLHTDIPKRVLPHYFKLRLGKEKECDTNMAKIAAMHSSHCKTDTHYAMAV